MVTFANVFNREPHWYWFGLGIIFFFVLRYSLLLIIPKISNWSQTEKTRNFILFVLNLVIVMAALAFTFWSVYITALAGSGQMNYDQFVQLSNQLQSWINVYVAFIWIFIGIAAGGVILFLTQVVTRLFRRLGKERVLPKSSEKTDNVDVKSNNNPKINIDLRIDSADIAKMDSAQRMDISILVDKIDKLKHDESKEK